MRGTFYVWVRSRADTRRPSSPPQLLEEIGVVATPGSGFGPSGEGYIRFSLTVATAIG